MRARFISCLIVLMACVAVLGGFPKPATSLQKHNMTWTHAERLEYDLLVSADDSLRGMPLVKLAIYRHKNPSRFFKAMLGEATPKGKVYALAGLAIVDPDYFQQQLPHYKNNTTPVPMHEGHKVLDVPMHQVIEEIESMPRSRSLKLSVDMMMASLH